MSKRNLPNRYQTYDDVKEPRFWTVSPIPVPDVHGLAPYDRLTLKEDRKIYKNGNAAPWAEDCRFTPTEIGATIDATHTHLRGPVQLVFVSKTRIHTGTGPIIGPGTWTAEEGP